MAKSDLTTLEQVEKAILIVRGYRVLLDRDLATLYGVEVKVLKQSVKRNIERFPSDFMFTLSVDEARSLMTKALGPSAVGDGSRSQSVTLNAQQTETVGLPDTRAVRLKRGANIKYLPYAFTEQGVAMLSSVLRSAHAVQVNIEIMRAFVRLRQLLQGHSDLAMKLADLEQRYDGQFRVVFEAIDELMTPPGEPVAPIGFRPG